MERIKCIVSYDGTDFSGYQIQPNKRTIQGEFEHVLSKIHKGDNIRIYASGRTDAGVHAVGQVIHFDTPLKMKECNWMKAINTLLPEDIYVKKCTIASPNFHARFSAKEKEYRYYIDYSKERNVFKRNYAYHYPYDLDINRIQKACKHLEGTHDFTTFSSAKTTTKGDKVRTLYEVSCSKNVDTIRFVVRGNGFLYHMVRIIIGVLLDVGRGFMEPEDIVDMIEKRDRKYAGKTVPPQGLYLYEVKYK